MWKAALEQDEAACRYSRIRTVVHTFIFPPMRMTGAVSVRVSAFYAHTPGLWLRCQRNKRERVEIPTSHCSLSLAISPIRGVRVKNF